MNEAQVSLVESEGFTINVPFVGSPMTVRTKSDEIVILMRMTVRPRDNVMDIDLDVSASGDGASVSRLDEDAPSEFSGYWSPPFTQDDSP